MLKHSVIVGFMNDRVQKGEADLVQYGGNKDGQITLREVERYLDSEMTYEAIKINRQQNATISGDLERVLSKYNR